MSQCTWKKVVLVFQGCFTFVFSIPSIGQNPSSDSLYLWFDQKIGILNSGLYASEAFVEEYQVINEKHRFFESPNYLTGTLWCQDIPYHQVFLKYDLFQDKIIVYPREITGVSPIQLTDSQVDSFQIRNKKFIKKIATNIGSNSIFGFFEVLVKSKNYSLLKKHRKIDVRKLNRNRVYYEFKPKDEYILEYEGSFYPIKRPKDVIGLFPLSKELQKKLLSKKTGSNVTDGSLRVLLQEIDANLEKLKPKSL
nr:hypothetical protein [uncultured Allomuricauda sp.]